MKVHPLALAALVSISCLIAADTVPLKGKSATVRIELQGGTISSFQLSDLELNPLTWEPGEDAGSAKPHPRGHFLCLDRWGPPTDAEAKNGMPFHGEASHVTWKLNASPVRKGQWFES